MTVCPPKGSDTARNFDLMRAKDQPLTDAMRMELQEAADDIFIIQPGVEYARNMVALINKNNLRNTYFGLQTFPKTYNKVNKGENAI